MQSPLISIITLTLNAEKYIEQTIQSVLKQTYQKIEYIIVDGRSTDKTIEIINKYKHRVNHFVSEKDEGISDAMNKGIALSTGDYVVFLHADDYFENEKSIENALEFLDDGCEIMACDIKFGKELKTIKPRGFNFLFNFKGIPHQGIICQRLLIEKLNGFNKKFQICMDYDLLFRAYKNGARIRKAPIVLSVMRDTGISSRQDWQSLKKRFDEERKVHLKNCTSLSMKILYPIYWFLYLPYRRSSYKLKASLLAIKKRNILNS